MVTCDWIPAFGGFEPVRSTARVSSICDVMERRRKRRQIDLKTGVTIIKSGFDDKKNAHGRVDEANRLLTSGQTGVVDHRENSTNNWGRRGRSKYVEELSLDLSRHDNISLVHNRRLSK
jgi:hypothetical protein